jgi:glycosyltransferase involved in cell wall biosynthesis
MEAYKRETTLSSPSTSPELSVVIPALNEGHYLRRTVEQLANTLPAASEIVVIDNGSTDGSADSLAETGARLLRTPRLGAAGARNWGAWNSAGKVIVFADAHVEVQPGWWEPLVETLARPEVGAAGPVVSAIGRPDARGYGYWWTRPDMDFSSQWLGARGQEPYPVPMLSSCFIAIRRETFTTIGGFDSGLRRWGAEDSELSLRLWLLGYEQVVVPQVEIAHLFRTKHPYQIEMDDVLHNLLRLAFTHFNSRRIEHVIASVKEHLAFAPALAQNVAGNVWKRRNELLRRRMHDDDWYFERFEMGW